MGQAQEMFRGGQLVGYRCGDGHQHSSKYAAETCDSDAFAKEKQEELSQNEKARVRLIKDSPDFPTAVRAVQFLGSDDADVAEEVILRNGLEAVLSAADKVRALRIPPPAPKPKKDPAGKTPDPKV
jgi:hypothetical protein